VSKRRYAVTIPKKIRLRVGAKVKKKDWIKIALEEDEKTIEEEAR